LNFCELCIWKALICFCFKLKKNWKQRLQELKQTLKFGSKGSQTCFCNILEHRHSSKCRFCSIRLLLETLCYCSKCHLWEEFCHSQYVHQDFLPPLLVLMGLLLQKKTEPYKYDRSFRELFIFTQLIKESIMPAQSFKTPWWLFSIKTDDPLFPKVIISRPLS